MLDSLRQDLTYAARGFTHRPAFALTAVAVMAVGIGANTMIFSVAGTVLVHDLPYEHDERVVNVFETNAAQNVPQMATSMPILEDWRERAESFETFAASYSPLNVVMAAAEPVRLTASIVTPSLFSITDVAPVIGRTLQEPEDDSPEGGAVALLSHEAWSSHFGADPGILGRVVLLNDQPFVVVGVMPEEFPDFPNWQRRTDVWLPAHVAPSIYGRDILRDRAFRAFNVLALLREGVARDTALLEMQAIAEQLGAEYPDLNAGWSVGMRPVRAVFFGDYRGPVITLLVGASLLLLVGCANVASLMLVRASQRRRELSLRRALGAAGIRLLRQLLVESLALTLVGGLAGALLAAWGTRAVVALSPLRMPGFATVGVDGGVLLASLAVAGLIGLTFAVLHALQSRRLDLRGALAGSGKGDGLGATGGRTRAALVVVEVALAVVLLVGAGLMLRSLAALRDADIGFWPDRIVTMVLELPGEGYDTEDLPPLHEELLSAVRDVPGLDSANLWSPHVPSEATWYTRVRLEDRPRLRDDELPLVRFHSVADGAITGLGLQLTAGRDISRIDVAAGRPVVLVSESTARTLWPGESAIGKGLRRWNRDAWLEVVGVVADAKHSGRQGIGSDTDRDVYFPYYVDPQRVLVVLARATGEPDGAVDALRAAVGSVVPGQPVYDVRTMEDRLARQESASRFTAVLASGYAIMAIALASIGLYSVLAFSVCQRAHEIGVRLALGAQPSVVRNAVVRQGMQLAVIGVLVGGAAAFGLARLLESVLYGVSSSDALTFTAAPAGLLAIALLACLLPARRATCVDPLVTLRAQ